MLAPLAAFLVLAGANAYAINRSADVSKEGRVALAVEAFKIQRGVCARSNELRGALRQFLIEEQAEDRRSGTGKRDFGEEIGKVDQINCMKAFPVPPGYVIERIK